MLAAGHSYREVRERLDCSDEYIRESKKRFQEERLAGLDSRYRDSQPRTRTAEGEARILEATRQGPTDGTTHWSSYRLAKKLGLSQSSVSRVWRHFGIQPQSLYAALDTRTGDVIGKTAERHTSVEFVDFLSTIVASQPAGREIHIVAENLSAHKTKGVGWSARSWWPL